MITVTDKAHYMLIFTTRHRLAWWTPCDKIGLSLISFFVVNQWRSQNFGRERGSEKSIQPPYYTTAV